ncbi:TetR/AcrR family transcriptional regulator [Roseomonas aeriglobus]|nr:TetR/AcrR family transcriptional regulator [Roseomonas aeriglobus]
MTLVDFGSKRRRRQPDELRSEAIGAAREILLKDGPASITLQSVAAALGMAHGSITHHFGTAANLQAAVADELIGQLLAGVRSGACALKTGTIDEADLVDLVFDVFEETGVGRLIGWLAAYDSPLLQPMFERFGRLSAEIAGDQVEGSAFMEAELPVIIENVVTAALSSALIGADLLKALDLGSSHTRERVAVNLAAQRSKRFSKSSR